MTDYKVHALARMLGITPSTHRHLFEYAPPDFPGEGLTWRFTGPEPHRVNADLVWAVPLMWWLRDHGYTPMIHSMTGAWEASIYGGTGSWYAGPSNTMTAALLDAAMHLPEFQQFKEAKP